MAKKRTPPAELVGGSYWRRGYTPWHEQLSTSDLAYVVAVVQEMRRNPDAPIHTVAENLVKELSLTVTPKAVARTLKEFLNAKA